MDVKKNLPVWLTPSALVLNLAESAIFFSTSNFDLWYFYSLFTFKNVQYLIKKDLIHICSETEAQGRGMIFNISYVWLKVFLFYIIQRPLLKQKVAALYGLSYISHFSFAWYSLIYLLKKRVHEFRIF